MALYEEAFNRPFVFMEKKLVSNGMGGFDESYIEGETFNGALVLDTSTEARIAEKQGVTSLYTLTVPLDVPLEYSDVIKDVDTNSTYRITSRSGGKRTPNVASFQFQQFNVELYSI